MKVLQVLGLCRSGFIRDWSVQAAQVSRLIPYYEWLAPLQHVTGTESTKRVGAATASALFVVHGLTVVQPPAALSVSRAGTSGRCIVGRRLLIFEH